jgi:hypothetical protein
MLFLVSRKIFRANALNVIELKSGEQALWYKSTKAIKHIECSIRSSGQVTSSKDDDEEFVIMRQDKKNNI